MVRWKALPVEESSVSDLFGVLVQQRLRLREIADVLGRYGLAGLANHVAAAEGRTSQSVRYLASKANPELAEQSTGERVRGALGELGPTWIKFGQMLSVRADIVGAEVAGQLANLQRAVPADRPGYAEEVIRAELGAPVEEVFATFEEVPIASGSVAQVHRAGTHGGDLVAVKVLHEDVERRVRGDLELMKALADFLESVDPEIARYTPSLLVSQFEGLMRSAMDLTREASNLTRFRANFGREPDVVIPAPFLELSTSRVLTMELMTGGLLDDAASVERAGWAVDDLVHRTSKIFLDMIFRDGIYHADPHPGNFLLRAGEIVILDFGDTGTLRPSSRTRLESLLIAVSEGGMDDITDAMLELTDAPRATDRAALGNEVSLVMAPYLGADTSELDISNFIGSILEVTHHSKLQLPSDLAMVLRVLTLLQGLCLRVDAKIDFVQLIRPYMVSAAHLHLDPGALSRRALRNLRRWDALLASLPEDLEDLAGRMRDGSMDVDLRLHDAEGNIDHLVDGLLVAALVVGASELISRGTKPAVVGFSVPGALAAGLGLLTYQRLQRRRSSYVNVPTRAIRLAQSIIKNRPTK